MSPPYDCDFLLRSFPTRRSSDLIQVTVLDEADHMADLGFLPGVKRILDRTPAKGQRMLFSATDRKSTRLNSSHVAISYAVFCLKKKKSDSYPRSRKALLIDSLAS